MGHKKRTYEIVEAVGGGAPNTTPVMRDDKGHVIAPNELLTFDKNIDNMRKVDHYRVRFEIKHFNQSRLRFTPNKSDALWVKKGTGPGNCPTSACHDLPDTFWVDEMDEQNGEWIDVINMDMQKEEFWFTLNLVDKSDPTSTNYVPVDPGGGNENGGAPGSGSNFFSWSTSLALGAGAGILAFTGAQLLLTR